MLLAIDTSTGTSVAVVDRAHGVRAVRTVADTRSHAEVIGVLIREVLESARLAPTALEGVVIGMGPGPFTGLRVGIAAGRSFALGIDAPVIPLVSHDAVAFAQPDAVLVVTDARRRELAWSSYAAPDGSGVPRRIEGPALATVVDFPEVAAAHPAHRRIDAATVDAGALGLLAVALVDAGAGFGPGEPLYLRAPDVTLSTPKRVSG